MFTIEVCLQDARRTIVGRYRYNTAEAAKLGRIDLLESWVKKAKLKVLVSATMVK